MVFTFLFKLSFEEVRDSGLILKVFECHFENPLILVLQRVLNVSNLCLHILDSLLNGVSLGALMHFLLLEEHVSLEGFELLYICSHCSSSSVLSIFTEVHISKLLFVLINFFLFFFQFYWILFSNEFSKSLVLLKILSHKSGSSAAVSTFILRGRIINKAFEDISNAFLMFTFSSQFAGINFSFLLADLSDSIPLK